MSKKLLITLLISQLCACSVTLVYVEKHIYVDGKGNMIEQVGSDLKDNTATQTSDGTLKVPLVK